MNSEKDWKQLRKLIEEALHKANLTGARIILFGSRVRGNSDQYSDFDVLVVIDRPLKFNDKINILGKIYHRLRGFPYAVDIILKTNQEYEVEKEMIGTLINSLVREKGGIRNKEYQDLCGVKKRQATDDIKELENKNILQRVGRTGKGTIYRLEGSQRAQRINP